MGEGTGLPFFFYGTLLAADADQLRHRLTPGLAAQTAGALHALPDAAGWYPALQPARSGPVVIGRLFAATPAFGPDDLAALDAYEDYRPDEPAASEYRRQAILVRCSGQAGHVRAQAYCYNRPLPGAAVAVPDGDFAAWLVRHGRRAFRP